MKCPQCGNEWTPDASEIAAEFGRRTSKAKARAARRNAKLGGWPKGKKRGKRKPDANQIAHGVVAKAEKLTRQIEKADRRVTSRGELTQAAIRSLDFTRQGPTPQRLKVLPNPKAPKRAR